MANLMLSHNCTLKCNFCFALDLPPQKATSESSISPEVFQAYVDFLDRSGLQEVRLLGGEPTIHQEFVRFVQYAQRMGKKVIVFSNGLIPAPALKALIEIPTEQCTVMINVTSGENLLKVRRRQISVMRQLGPRACPGYTISYVADCDLTSILDLIEETACQRNLRIALAQPARGKNIHIHPKQYRVLAPRIVTLAVEAYRRGVRLEFDCGFVRCMFSEEELESLRKSDVSLTWHCSPVIDFDIDGSVFPCFALSGQLRIPNGFMRNVESLRQEFQEALAVLRVAGTFPQCSTCDWRVTQQCSGGCLAAALKRIRQMPIRFVMRGEDAAAFLKDINM